MLYKKKNKKMNTITHDPSETNGVPIFQKRLQKKILKIRTSKVSNIRQKLGKLRGGDVLFVEDLKIT